MGRGGGVCRAAAEAIGAVSAAEPRRAEGPRQRRPKEPLSVAGAQRRETCREREGRAVALAPRGAVRQGGAGAPLSPGRGKATSTCD